MYVYVGFLTREIQEKIDHKTTMFQVYTWHCLLQRHDYVLAHRSYLREILALILKNVEGYIDETMKFDILEEEIIIDSDETRYEIQRARLYAEARLISHVEYLKQVAFALDAELSKEVV